MKILIVHARYFPFGGAESYLFNITRALEEQGHEVIPFSVEHEANVPSPYSRYFLPAAGNPQAVRHADQHKTPRYMAAAMIRSVYSPAAARRIRHLVHDVRPDAALVLHFLRRLSPSVLNALHQESIPTLVRISDFQLVCPAATCFRDGTPCQACFQGSFFPAVQHRCVRNSRGASLLAFAANEIHRRAGWINLPSGYLFPSRFTMERHVEAGFDPARCRHLPTFTDLEHFQPPPQESPARHLLYAGRFEPHKGVEVLLAAYEKAAAEDPHVLPLVFAGPLDSTYARTFREKTSTSPAAPRIRFIEHADRETLVSLYQDAAATILPMLWYENQPNALVESLACGTPVIASNRGSLPEFVEDGRTGFLVPPADPEALAGNLLAVSRGGAAPLRAAARKEAETCFPPALHIDRLLQCFHELGGVQA